METTSKKAFHAYGNKMRVVMELRYLGRLMTNTDDNWSAVAGNLRKARVTWGRLVRILGRVGVDPKVSRHFYIAVTQQVLLFGAETWVLTKRIEDALDTFQGRVARRLTGRMPRRGEGRKVAVSPPGGSYQGSGDSASEDIGPPETEYGPVNPYAQIGRA